MIRNAVKKIITCEDSLYFVFLMTDPHVKLFDQKIQFKILSVINRQFG